MDEIKKSLMNYINKRDEDGQYNDSYWLEPMIDKFFDGYQIPPASKVTKYAPKQEWISVNDRVPEEYEGVLVVDELGKVRIGFFMRLCDGESCWMTLNDYMIKPSHWMPLPKPPESAQKSIDHKGLCDGMENF